MPASQLLPILLAGAGTLYVCHQNPRLVEPVGAAACVMALLFTAMAALS
ncbi:hypothetical protein ACFYMO_28210 [Streptomyces sp. NPDC007025]